jgi:hypothetical protein
MPPIRLSNGSLTCSAPSPSVWPRASAVSSTSACVMSFFPTSCGRFQRPGRAVVVSSGWGGWRRRVLGVGGGGCRKGWSGAGRAGGGWRVAAPGCNRRPPGCLRRSPEGRSDDARRCKAMQCNARQCKARQGKAMRSKPLGQRSVETRERASERARGSERARLHEGAAARAAAR